MARFFKPLLGAVALAAATLTSTGAFAAYAYNAQVTITAPKGSTAETAAKDKTKPTGMKYSSCALDASAGGVNFKYPDFLQISVKYDAGKLAAEIGDVYLVLQNLSVDDTGAAPAARYINVGRPAGAGLGTAMALTLGAALGDLDTVTPFLSAADNLGVGAQTEILFGGAVGLAGLSKGLWSATVIIANPGATLTAAAVGGAAATPVGTTANSFLFGMPESWAAHDTAVFMLGSPLAIDSAATLSGVNSGAASNVDCE